MWPFILPPLLLLPSPRSFSSPLLSHSLARLCLLPRPLQKINDEFVWKFWINAGLSAERPPRDPHCLPRWEWEPSWVYEYWIISLWKAVNNIYTHIMLGYNKTTHASCPRRMHRIFIQRRAQLTTTERQSSAIIISVISSSNLPFSL